MPSDIRVNLVTDTAPALRQFEFDADWRDTAAACAAPSFHPVSPSH